MLLPVMKALYTYPWLSKPQLNNGNPPHSFHILQLQTLKTISQVHSLVYTVLLVCFLLLFGDGAPL